MSVCVERGGGVHAGGEVGVGWSAGPSRQSE